MKLSKLNELPTTRKLISAFGGYNHNVRIGEGEFYEMRNLTSNDYPVLSPRPKRGIFRFPNELTAPTVSGITAKGNDLYYVVGNDLYKNTDKIASLSPNNEKRTLVSMGAYLIVFPDKKYINTTNYEDSGDLEKVVELQYDGSLDTTYLGQIEFKPCTLDGKPIEPTVANTEPKTPNALDYWLDTSVVPSVLKQYDGNQKVWMIVASTYVSIDANIAIVKGGVLWRTSIGKMFETGEGVSISGVDVSKLRPMSEDGTSVSNTVQNQIEALLGTPLPIKGRTYDRIVVPGLLDYAVKFNLKVETRPIVTVSRKLPEMDFVIESGNRLWGCKSGATTDNKVVNEIYASKLGDPKNWYCFEGISTDSYAATVGSDGAFTGAINYLGIPHFFKENCIHKVYGNFPSNFQIQDTTCRGVQEGSSESLALVNETLFYKSRSAVCAYDGSLPTEISNALGDVPYDTASAGALGNKYYISMRDYTAGNGVYRLFVYDSAKGMWHKEDETQATKFVSCKGNLYYIDYGAENNPLRMIRHESGADTEAEAIKWSATTGVIGVDMPDKKYISSIEVRMQIERDTTVWIYIEYDSCGEWEQLYAKTGNDLCSFSIPMRPRRCDHLRLKIVGVGGAKIYSITKTIEQGSNAR
jgi:hypothetical protein